MKIKYLIIMLCLFAIPCIATANPIDAGTGVNTALVYIEWSDGFNIEFNVHFGTDANDTTTGLGLLNIIEAETELTTIREYYSFGELLTGIGYLEHSNVNPADWSSWWNYWEKNAGDNASWKSSMTGAGGRIVSNGDADGWIFGRNGEPEPESENPFIEGYKQYYFDANDFTVEWIAYEPNGMIRDWLNDTKFNNPESALGRPTVDTSGDDWFIPMDTNVPVVPVNPAFRSHELAYLGEQGMITLAFNHQVSDDIQNPYGIDFIVFGNAAQSIGQNQQYTNGDPQATTVSSTGGIEPSIVSVSQDGQTWYSFTNDPNFMKNDPNFIILDPNSSDGPFCDGFAPTLGRVYDPCNANNKIGTWNKWWAEETNPTLPLNPIYAYQSFGGMTIAQIAQTYGDSAGGTGYNIAHLDLPVDPNTDLKWFKYIRIDDKKDGSSAEIDAVADVSCPGDYRHPAPLGDMNGDYRVDNEDISIAEGYLEHEITSPDDEAAIADLNNDEIVNQDDIDIITANLGTCTWGNTTLYE